MRALSGRRWFVTRRGFGLTIQSPGRVTLSCHCHSPDVTLLPVQLPVEDAVSKQLEARGFKHVEEVLQSECFKRATTLRSLLVYLWRNRGKDVSEYAIAVDALGRNPDFESKIDASVRVQISRLRQFLTKYYESEGRQSTIRLAIPLGTHEIQLIEIKAINTPERYARAEEVIVRLPPAPEVPRVRGRFLVPVLGSIIAVLLLCIGFLLWRSAHGETQSGAVARQDLPLFWKTFMDNGKSTRIVLPTPVFFSWDSPIHENSLMFRDTAVNDFAKWERSAQLVDLEKRWGKPNRWQNYTVASDTFASLRLARFLDSYGIQTSISSAPESPHGIIDHENIVTFGTASSLAPFQSDLDRLSFRLVPHERFIIDKHLPAGSAGLFPALRESASRQVVPGIIALLPRGSSGSRILIVQSIQTTALISFLTSETGMHEILQAEAEQGDSPYFEAVVLSEVNAGTPLQSRLVAFRRFGAPEPPPHPVNEASLAKRASSPVLLTAAAHH
jgi:hypothetical protein